MKLLIKYASRGRRQLFEETIKNIQETISGEYEYKIEVSADSDDITMSYGEKKFNFDERVEISYGYSLNKIHAINRDMDYITAEYDWDILIVMSDDMKFVVKDWDKAIVAEYNKVGPDCFLHFNDGFVGEKLPTMAIMDREYYERFFYIYPPCYKSFSCDAEQMFVAQMLGKWHYFPQVLFKHEHPANIHGIPTDKTYTDADKHQPHDTEVFFKRLKKLFYVNNPVMIPELMKPYL